MKLLFLALLAVSAVSLRAQAVNPDPPRNLGPFISNPTDNTGKLVNISTRAVAGSGDAALAVGFAVSEQSRYVLIRAVGPTLARFGITSFLRKPRLSLYDSSGSLITTAISWSTSFSQSDKSGIALVAANVGAFALPDPSDDAVIHAKLAPGTYSIVISSDDGQVGTVLAEIYASPTYGFGNP